MASYITRRLLFSVFVIFILTLVIFFTMHLLPGDPLLLYIDENTVGDMAVEKLEVLRHEFGLDKPLPLQYTSWIGGILRGDFGTSIAYHEDVGSLMLEFYPPTLYLGMQAFFLSAIVGMFLGIVSGLRQGTWVDSAATTLAYFGISVPVFWLAILMILLFGLHLNWLPISGYTSPFDDLAMSIKQSIMPVICLAITGLAATARQMRSALIGVIREDYIRTAWSKGLRESTIISRHALKNSLIPVLTLIGINVRVIFGGSVIIETLFNIPGMGRLMVSSIFDRDYVVVQSCALIIALIVVFVNFLVDIAYGWLDPRIKYN